MQSAFVTGSTGLLGNNLVRGLVARGIRVRALARSRAKAARQFAGLDVEVVKGDLADIDGFAPALAGSDALFHTAAFFRDSYKGGNHRDALIRTNVHGTEALMAAAYAAGIRRMVHTSSVAVLTGSGDGLVDETMERRDADADDYYLSKILADRAVQAFLAGHPDMFCALVLPGWMFGPGDMGPTSAGQLVRDLLDRRLAGRVPGAFAPVDARDVAEHLLAALERGRSGERYIAAGAAMTMDELLPLIGRLSGVPAPTRHIPLPLMNAMAAFYELQHALTGRPVLLSRATVRLLARERSRAGYDHRKSERELGLTLRPLEETLADTIAWVTANADQAKAA
jgi:nucleoside-diphosphate-sugar epimerase